jgi:hypothetical protein
MVWLNLRQLKSHGKVTNKRATATKLRQYSLSSIQGIDYWKQACPGGDNIKTTRCGSSNISSLQLTQEARSVGANHCTDKSNQRQIFNWAHTLLCCPGLPLGSVLLVLSNSTSNKGYSAMPVNSTLTFNNNGALLLGNWAGHRLWRHNPVIAYWITWQKGHRYYPVRM